jgi:hypothetical protein
MRDAVIAAIRNCAEHYAAIETEAARAEAGNVAAAEVVPFLSLIDVNLALLPRIGRAHGAVARVYTEYVSRVRAEAAEAAEAARAEGPADECKAADALLDALSYSTDALGEFMYYTWRRSARYGTAVATHRQLYLFNGATYDRVGSESLSWMAERHMHDITRSLAMPSEPWASSIFNARGIMKKALKRMHDLLKEPLLEAIGLERAMDAGPYYIGMKNGVFDLRNRRFIPKGAVPLNTLVSMRTRYAYPEQSDPVIRARIERLFYSIFENNETTDYLMKVLASCFALPREEYYVFTGNGGNGKGVLAALMRAVFGSYLTTDTRRVTTQRVVVAEAQDNRDVRYYAKLWSTRHRKDYTLFILTNNPMERTRRVDPAQRVVRFPFQFVGQVKVTEPWHRVVDPNLKGMIRDSDAWGAEMFMMLMETYAAR